MIPRKTKFFNGMPLLMHFKCFIFWVWLCISCSALSADGSQRLLGEFFKDADTVTMEGQVVAQSIKKTWSSDHKAYSFNAKLSKEQVSILTQTLDNIDILYKRTGKWDSNTVVGSRFYISIIAKRRKRHEELLILGTTNKGVVYKNTLFTAKHTDVSYKIYKFLRSQRVPLKPATLF